MKFVKKLVIMVGQSTKGTASFERNAYGVTVAVNTYNLHNLNSGEYIFAVKNGDKFIVKTLERLSQKFELEDMELESIHCAVIYGDKCIMYGTNQSKRIWEGSFVDEALRNLASQRVNLSPSTVRHDADAKPIEYSPRPKIDDFFLEVLPKERYEDDAIAQVNYYSREPIFSRPPSPSIPARDVSLDDEFKLNILSEDETSELMNNREGNTAYKNVKTNAFNDDKPRTLKTYTSSPSDMERAYINTFLSGCAFCEIDKFNRAKNVASGGTNTAPNGMNSSPNGMNGMPNGSSGMNGNNSNGMFNTPNGMPNNNSNSLYDNGIKSKLSNMGKTVGERNLTKVPELAKIMADEAAATAPPIKRDMPNLRTLTFYEQVENQLKDLFDKNPREQNLEKLMPDTKWVKVDFDGKGRYYVVGIINKDFICYGVPAKYTPHPPLELDGYCQWLPSNPQKPQDTGYWLMFQDAVTGESVKKDVV